MESRGLAVWTGWSKDGKEQNHAWFDHRAGCVTVKNPDEEIISKMCSVAVALNATVRGDEGELYAPANRQSEISKPDARPWWRRLFS